MNIGFDAKRAFCNGSGLGTYSRETIYALKDFFPNNKYFLFTTKVNNSLFNEKYCENVIIPQNTSKINKSFWRSFSIYNDINENNIDVFHGLSNEIPITIKKTKAFNIVTIHDLIFLKHPELYNTIDTKIYNYKSKKACNIADKIIAISEETKKDLIYYYQVPENKIEIVYQSYNEVFDIKANEIEINNIKKRYNLPENFILNVGTIEKRKNILSAIKAIHEHNIDTNLVIIGRKTDYYNEIDNYVKEKKLQNKIFVLNNVPNCDLPLIYQASKIFIYPSHYEGFGLPIIEAFASEKPVITGNSGAMKEVAGDAAILIDTNNIHNIADAIISLINDKKLSDNYISLSKNRAAFFSRKNMAEKLFNIYAQKN